MHILITGAKGFVGRNLVVALNRRKGISLYEYDLETKEGILDEGLRKADVIYHLAGVNRPKSADEFHAVNVGMTQHICDRLAALGKAPKIVLSSSIQASLDNPYGVSKRHAEEVLKRFAEETGAACVVYRFKNLFGKWCRPNYNSVTATFCHNIAHDLPLYISDPLQEIELSYIGDVVEAFIGEIAEARGGFRFAEELPSERVTLEKLASLIKSFRELRTALLLPDFSISFVRALYATYLSYLAAEEFGYSLQKVTDERGELAELLKSPQMGQIFVSRTKPGISRGNHYHDSKAEKFIVLEGEAMIRLRHILEADVTEFRVSGRDFKVINIPPGYTHSLENVGSSDLVVLFWAIEMFDRDRPDTYFEEVLKQ